MILMDVLEKLAKYSMGSHETRVESNTDAQQLNMNAKEHIVNVIWKMISQSNRM